MPTAEFRPGPLYFSSMDNNVTTGYTVLAGTYPGGSGWADDSDASFFAVESWRLSPMDGRTTLAAADFDTMPAGVTAVAVWVRYTMLDTSGVPFPQIYLNDAADPTNNTIIDAFSVSANPNPTTPTWVELGALPNPADVSSTTLRALVFDDNPAGTERAVKLNVYEVKLVVTWEARGLPPLRQDLCRDDVARVWPVSSQQASTRQFGGYY